MDEGEKSVTIRIPVSLWHWLDARTEGKTRTIKRLLEQEREEQAK